MEESTFPETCLPTPVPREAISSSAADWRPSSRPLRRRRVAGALRSFAEDEGDGVEKFPKDLLACSSAGEDMSSTPGRPRATAACQRPSSRALWQRRLLEAGAFLLPLVCSCFLNSWAASTWAASCIWAETCVWPPACFLCWIRVGFPPLDRKWKASGATTF